MRVIHKNLLKSFLSKKLDFEKLSTKSSYFSWITLVFPHFLPCKAENTQKVIHRKNRKSVDNPDLSTAKGIFTFQTVCKGCEYAFFRQLSTSFDKKGRTFVCG